MWQIRMKYPAAAWALAASGLLLTALSVPGCSGQRPMAPVSGKVTYKGEPVKGGEVVFSPIAAEGEVSAGKPAVGTVKADGTFVLMTFNPGDGAFVGKHRVTFMPPAVELALRPNGSPRENDPNARSPYAGLVARPAEVEIKSEANNIEIQLAPPG